MKTLYLLPLFIFFLELDTYAETRNPSLRSKLRSRNFIEFMSPGFSQSRKSVPHYEGGPLVPAFASGFFWIDYEINPKHKLLYFQNYTLDFSGATTPSGVGGRFLDPRFAFRFNQVFDIKGMSTDYDLFIQPGMAGGLMPQLGRLFDIGARTNTQYTVPKSNFSIGAITEITKTFYHKNGQGSDIRGLFIPWVSYQLNSRLSTQHFWVAPFKHQRGNRWNNFRWDITGMPYIQNGLGSEITNQLFVSLLINNYLMRSPSLQNTWASLWVSLKLL